ncbi:MAG: hypothetical protein U0T75_15025 [Chitinophagales bacterium]
MCFSTKWMPAIIALLLSITVHAQSVSYEQQRFCTNLEKVLEDGRKENFESINGTGAKQSAFLVVPGYSIKLDPFGIIYVDKDNRFVGKTNQNFDSLSALKKLEELKPLVNYCLDSTMWYWTNEVGDDSTTVFFKEEQQLQAHGAEFIISLAVDKVAAKLYTVNLYIKRKRR